MRWERHVAHIGESRGEYGVVLGKPERKAPLIRPVCVDGWIILEMTLKEIVSDGFYWINPYPANVENRVSS
jgi:hypothetical protein